jgi:hypothetical protein
MPQNIEWYYWVILAVANIGIYYLILFQKRRYNFLLADLILAFTIPISLDVFLVFYAFLFDSSKCGLSPSITCLLNNNIGVLTIGAILIAGITIYVNARIKQSDEKRRYVQRRLEAFRQLNVALGELKHNLLHFATQIDDDNQFITFPATSFDATFSLFENKTISFFHPILVDRLNTLQRILQHNKATLSAASDLDESIKIISKLDLTGIATISSSCALWEWEKLEAKQDVDGAIDDNNSQRKSILKSPIFDERIVTHSVRFIMETAYFHDNETEESFSESSFRCLDKMKKEMKTRGSYFYIGKSSELEEIEAADLRSKGGKLFCWIKDNDVEGIEIIGTRTIFRDLCH